MSLTYTSWLAAAANLAGTTTANTFFLAEVPNAIDYAEQEMLRQLDLINNITPDSTQVCVPNNRNITVPSAFVVVNDVNIITPAGTTPDSGHRVPITRKSEAVLDLFWPDATAVGVPSMYAMRSQYGMILGQWPDQAYVVEIIGTQRPAPLSAANQTTFLSLNLPDVFLAGTMVHIAGYQKNFGAQADDPRSAVSWMGIFQAGLKSANREELRKRYEGSTAAPPHGAAEAPPPAPAR